MGSTSTYAASQIWQSAPYQFLQLDSQALIRSMSRSAVVSVKWTDGELATSHFRRTPGRKSLLPMLLYLFHLMEKVRRHARFVPCILESTDL